MHFSWKSMIFWIYHSFHKVLQWCHISVTTPQITGNSTVCLTINTEGNVESLHYWPFVRETTGDLRIVLKRASNAESFSMSRRHLDLTKETWWRHQIETFSALLAICGGNSPVPGEFPAQRPVTRSFDVFFDLHLNKRLSKKSWGWWFERLSRPLWHHCNEYVHTIPWHIVLLLASDRPKYVFA